MDNARVAKALHTIAVLLEIKGENPFKVRSYANAAQRIEKLDEPVTVLIEEGRLRSLEGIGEALEKKVEEFLKTGEIAYLNTLKENYPETLLDLLRVEGLGIKSVKALYDSLGICSLNTLRQACETGQVAALSGFTANSERKFLNSLNFLEKHQGYFRLNSAWQMAALFRTHLLEHAPVVDVEIAGSLRRFNKLVKNINLVAASTNAPEVMNCFFECPETVKVSTRGKTRSTVVSKGGIHVDLCVVSPRRFPYAYLFLTGNKSHLALLHKHAASKGLDLKDNGLFAREDNAPLMCKNEAEIYGALNLPYIEAELREGLYEFQTAATTALVKQQDIQGLVHCHSTWSDGVNSIAEMANAAQQLGYQYIVITDHSQSSVHVNGLIPDRVEQQHAEINEINDLELSGFRIVKGIEADIRNDGSLDYEEDVLRIFEFIIASVHSNFDMTEAEATRRIIHAIENPFTSAIGHLTGRLLLTRRGYSVNIDKVVDAAVANGVAFEINANPRRLDMDWRYLHQAAEKGAKFIIGPDAHRIAGIHNVRYGLGTARKGALTPEHILNCLPVEKFLQWRKS